LGVEILGKKLDPNIFRPFANIDEIVELLLAEVGASLGTEVDPELLRPIDIPILRGDIAKLAGATGWSPEIPLAQTVSDIVQAFR
jgi:GDP-4-dehydro-6-deoxy-D-mannose reductase